MLIGESAALNNLKTIDTSLKVVHRAGFKLKVKVSV